MPSATAPGRPSRSALSTQVDRLRSMPIAEAEHPSSRKPRHGDGSGQGCAGTRPRDDRHRDLSEAPQRRWQADSKPRSLREPTSRRRSRCRPSGPRSGNVRRRPRFPTVISGGDLAQPFTAYAPHTCTARRRRSRTRAPARPSRSSGNPPPEMRSRPDVRREPWCRADSGRLRYPRPVSCSYSRRTGRATGGRKRDSGPRRPRHADEYRLPRLNGSGRASRWARPG
jgi:hypothetical protein